jgi:hypothetical protein
MAPRSTAAFAASAAAAAPSSRAKTWNGYALAYVYYEEEPGCRSAANLLARDEAWRIAADIAKLPDFVKRPQY